MVPHPIAFWEFYQEGDEELKIVCNKILNDSAVLRFCVVLRNIFLAVFFLRWRYATLFSFVKLVL